MLLLSEVEILKGNRQACATLMCRGRNDVDRRKENPFFRKL